LTNYSAGMYVAVGTTIGRSHVTVLRTTVSQCTYYIPSCTRLKYKLTQRVREN